MSNVVSRRTVLASAATGALATAVPWPAASAATRDNRFQHGVASGDPTRDSVIIWTRVTPGPDAVPGSGRGRPTRVHWIVAGDPQLENVVASGEVGTDAARDHTVKVDVTGLAVYTRYWYRFSVDGVHSHVGATRTAPDEPGVTHALRFAQVSCSNYTGGYFTSYASIAARTDLDFVLHLGDYYYEYGNDAGRFGPAELKGERDHAPAHETRTLSDYRARIGRYRTDPDLQAAHAALPWIVTFDDHEVANDAWSGGAQNHQQNEGDFAARRRAAYQAYQEWLPIRMPDPAVAHQGTRFFREFRFGDLADLSVLDTRQNRSEQVKGFLVLASVAGLHRQITDPDRHIMEPEQMSWLKDNIASRRGWHLIGNQVMLTPVGWPGQYMGSVTGSVLVNTDAWDGYRHDQVNLLTHMASQPASAGDTVVLTGDIHSSWAVDLVAETTAGQKFTPAGVEIVTPSVSSDSLYDILRKGLILPGVTTAATSLVAKALHAANPWLRYHDGVRHGYVVVDVTPQWVQADFYLTPKPSLAQPDVRLYPTLAPQPAVFWRTARGSRTLQRVAAPVGARSDEPRTPAGAAAASGRTIDPVALRTAEPRRLSDQDRRDVAAAEATRIGDRPVLVAPSEHGEPPLSWPSDQAPPRAEALARSYPGHRQGARR